MSPFTYSKTFELKLTVKVDSDAPLAGVDAAWVCSRINQNMIVDDWGAGVFSVSKNAAVPIPPRPDDPLVRIEAKLDALLPKADAALCCALCKRPRPEVALLVKSSASPACICDDCVDESCRLIVEARLEGRPKAMEEGRAGHEQGDRGAGQGSGEARVQADAQGDPGAAR